MKKTILTRAAAIFCLTFANVLFAYRYCSDVPLKPGADFRDCILINKNLSNADLAGADFSNAVLFRVDLRGADLSKARFTGAQLKFVNLRGARLQQADLTGARLYGIRAKGTVFAGADFTSSIVFGVNFNNSDLRFTNFTQTKIVYTWAVNADFLGANLGQASFSYTYFRNTACPSGQIVSNPETCADHGEVTYVSLGNSLTAGMQNRGLRVDFQEGSFPNRIAHELYLENFEQPLVDHPGVSNRPGKSPLYIDPVTGFPRDSAVTTPPVFLNISLPRPYNNLGIPGATTYDVLFTTDANARGGYNPLFEAILRPGAFGPSTQLEQTIFMDPTFITVWIGNNDVLGGVLKGTIIEGTTVTPPEAYKEMIVALLQTLLMETDADIVLANIPSITSIPFVTTVPKYVFDPSTFRVIPGNIPFVTEESDVKYVLLDALEEIKGGKGIPSTLGGANIPLPANRTLTASEAATVSTIINAYNTVLSGMAQNEDRIFLVDIDQLLSDVMNGEVVGCTVAWPVLDPEHSIFSLDGIHLNEKGYGLVSDLFVKSILANVKSWSD